MSNSEVYLNIWLPSEDEAALHFIVVRLARRAFRRNPILLGMVVRSKLWPVADRKVGPEKKGGNSMNENRVREPPSLRPVYTQQFWYAFYSD
jgi:hypothetical protein